MSEMSEIKEINDIKIVDCEVCMEKFPIDCFEFFPCAHKVCSFCYHRLKDLQCPYCRINMNVIVRINGNSNQSYQSYQSNLDNNLETIPENVSDFENDNFELPELPTNRRRNRNRNRNRNNNSRTYSERFSD